MFAPLKKVIKPDGAKIRILFILLLSLVFALNHEAFAIQIFGYEFNAPWSKAAKEKREAEKQKETERMVHTIEEWQERAVDIKMEHREMEPYKKEVDAKLVEKWDIPTFFDAYNKAPGSREFNLEKLKADKVARSQGVISPDFKKMAYTEAYFFPSEQSTLSAFFIYPLDMSKGKKQRVQEANVFGGAKKTPLISSTHEEMKEWLFSVFTVVDWSKDSKKVLLKERIGSGANGIYKTNVIVYFLEDDDTPYAYQKRFDRLNDMVKQYWFYKRKLNLNHYTWDIKPLGFVAGKEDFVHSIAFTYNTKDKEQVFLGLWSINIKTGEINLVSETPDVDIAISSNGLMMSQGLE